MAKNPRLVDITGQTFSRWRVIEQSGNTNRGGAVWLCECECGTIRPVIGADLRQGKSVSCGCWKSEVTGAMRRTHASSSTRLHNIWKGMRGRCFRVTNPKYYAYGARGITIALEWDDFAVFKEWALSNGYDETLTIERNDVNGNYEPSNCRWIPAVEQTLNRRNSLIAPDGELWVHKARKNSVKDAAFRRRIHDGWPPEEACSVPMNVRRVPRERNTKGQYS